MNMPKDMRIEWNERPIVRVEGMVMVRGDLGFSPCFGYENSRVAIYESVTCTEYLIYGYKIKDKSVVTLNALIPPRMPFTKATPIFQHWLIGGQRMGLSFNGTADARSFDRGIRVALENLEKAGSTRTSGSSSEEASSGSPTSTESFNLPHFDDISVPDTVPIVASQSGVASPKTLPTAPTFRPLAMSASSSRKPPTSNSYPQRRHSSSVPGRARRQPGNTDVKLHPTVTERNFEAKTDPSTTSSPTIRSASRHNSSCFNEDSSSKLSSTTDLVRPPPISTRRHKSRSRTESASNGQHRSRRTKTPNLDNLERQRDLKPTKPNPYVQIASNGNAVTRGPHSYSFPRINSRTSEGVHLAYSTTRFLAQRSAMYDYRYRGLTSSDDGHSDFSTAPLNPVSYAGSLKQPSNRADFKRTSSKEKEDLGERSRCRNCQVMFNHDRNFRGSCPDAPPDDCQKAIECVSCLCVPRCVFYSCDRDCEGNYNHEPCSCNRYHNGSRKRRWVLLGLLSFFIPCLCLYPILMNCHKCGVACRCCGSRHEPMPLNTKDNPKKS